MLTLQQVIEYHDFVMREVRAWRFGGLPWWTGSQCDIETRMTYWV